MTPKAVCTTGRKYHEESVRLARETAQRLAIPYVERKNESIQELRRLYGCETILVAKKGMLLLETLSGELFFHPNMAHLRIKNLRLGQEDHMVSAMKLETGMKVLDCTLGFGADAIVASYAVGAEGSVTGVEINPCLAEVIRYGMSHVLAENYDIHAAMRRIRVISADSLDFLRRQQTDAFDVVYFDPMFRHPLMESKSLAPLREIADHRAVSLEAIEEAKRVARHRVVFKENSRSLEFERLGFSAFQGGRYSKIKFGVMELGRS